MYIIAPKIERCLETDENVQAHPMMPYMAQGAAQATEDAAALTAALRKYPEDMAQALKIYEGYRKPRAAYVTKNTRILQEWLQ